MLTELIAWDSTVFGMFFCTKPTLLRGPLSAVALPVELWYRCSVQGWRLPVFRSKLSCWQGKNMTDFKVLWTPSRAGNSHIPSIVVTWKCWKARIAILEQINRNQAWQIRLCPYWMHTKYSETGGFVQCWLLMNTLSWNGWQLFRSRWLSASEPDP